jgi:DNA-binding PadR family transcriptional regulator
MARRKHANPLALAVLACLYERPMHPYEMATTMRARHKDESIKLNYGSLYAVVDSLHRKGLIEAQETEREGRRPERTVYRITDTGVHELVDWLSDLLSTPVKEYTQFEAGLSFLPVVSPAEAVALLGTRASRLDMDLAARRSVTALMDEHVPRLFSVEYEYVTMLLEAELAWVRRLIGDIDIGTLSGCDVWAGFHAQAHDPPDAPGPHDARDAQDTEDTRRAVSAASPVTSHPARNSGNDRAKGRRE